MIKEFDGVKLYPATAEDNHTVNELLTKPNELPPAHARNEQFKKSFA